MPWSSEIEAAKSRIPSICEILQVDPGTRSTRCPFHDDSSPSLSIYQSGERWTCHAGCGSGDGLDMLARLENIPLSEVFKRLGDIGRGSLPSKARKSQPLSIDPKQRARCAELWELSKIEIQSESSFALGTRNYLNGRLGADFASMARDRGLVGSLPKGSAWGDEVLSTSHRLVLPLFAIPSPGEDFCREPVDLVRRDVTGRQRLRYLSLRGAAPGIPKIFGRLSEALKEDYLVLVEGALNWLAWDSSRAPCLGLHGASSARKVGEALRSYLRWMKERGELHTKRIVLDFDSDEAGRKALTIFVEIFAPERHIRLQSYERQRPKIESRLESWSNES
jgi:hypothetical protein